MSALIAAVVYQDGVYPDRVFAAAIAPLRQAGMPLAGVLQVSTDEVAGRHPCDMLLMDLASGEVSAIAEYRGKHAQGCRLDVELLAGIGESVLGSLREGDARLLVVNKFGKIEAAGGGMRNAIVAAADLGIPVLVGVPARNLASWRTFAGDFSLELPADRAAIGRWLDAHGLGGEIQHALREAGLEAA